MRRESYRPRSSDPEGRGRVASTAEPAGWQLRTAHWGRWSRVRRAVGLWLPRGGQLPLEDWAVLHNAVWWLLVGHVPVLLAMAFWPGADRPDLGALAVVTAGPVTAAALARASWLSRRWQSLVASTGLLGCSLAVWLLAADPVEAQLHTFVMLTAIALYESWLPFGLAVGFVLPGPLVMGSDAMGGGPHPAWGIDVDVHSPARLTLHLGFFVVGALTTLVGWRLRELSRFHQESFATTLRYRLRHDRLTGLPNRDWLLEEGPSELAGSLSRDPSKGGPVAVLVVDVGRVAQVNDTLGHEAGDRLIVHVAGRLAASSEPGQVAVRLSGDEFAVVLVGDRARRPVEIAHGLWRAFVGDRVPLDAVDLGVNVTVGVAAAHGVLTRELLERLLRHADVAMASARRAHCPVAEYDPEADRSAVDRLALLADLQEALYTDQIQLAYQPQLDLRSAGLVGVEALLRWRHPSRGLVPPMHYIPAAETTNLVIPLTYRVLTLALIQTAQWYQLGQEIRVSVNVPPQALAEEDFVEMVVAALDATALPPHLLCLELTETSLMKDPERALVVMRELESHGVVLSLDDFGTGYSSLNYLRSLPVHELKIDKGFVQGLLQHEQDAVVVEATIVLAHRLGMRVVAEGVEDVPTQEALMALGCDIVQGFLHAPALPAGQITEWVAASAAGLEPVVPPWGEGVPGVVGRRG